MKFNLFVIPTSYKNIMKRCKMSSVELQTSEPPASSAGPPILNIFVIDQSGSMSGQEGSVVHGRNERVLQLPKPSPKDSLHVDIVFSSNTDIKVTSYPLDEVPIWGPDDYRPSGNTALRDAVMVAIRMASDYPDHKILIVIESDGDDTDSSFNDEEVAQAYSNLIAQNENCSILMVSSGSLARPGAMRWGLKHEQIIHLDETRRVHAYRVMADAQERFLSSGPSHDSHASFTHDEIESSEPRQTRQYRGGNYGGNCDYDHNDVFGLPYHDPTTPTSMPPSDWSMVDHPNSQSSGWSVIDPGSGQQDESDQIPSKY